ncbi:MAG: FAD-dependent monooxygenase [Pseudonocardiales bacterium]|nr:FAD-dependent monooxygenase [Pseudonocardiales bacterium]
MTAHRTALVIGGGIAGPAAAIALQKAGIDPVIYEAHPTGADDLGVFLILASNGIDALRVLDADQPALAAGFPTSCIMLRGATGKRLGQSRIGGTLPDGTTSHTLRRADLYRVLRDQAQAHGIRVEHGKRLIAAEDTGESVRAVFADGHEAVGDVLIGCDGVHSAVRRIIDPAAPPPAYSGLLTNGGYARGVAVDTEPGSYEMIFGRRAFFVYVTAPNGEVWWFSNAQHREEPARDEIANISTDEWRRRLLALYADDAGPATALIQATPQMTAMSPIHVLAHLPTWHRGRMIVIGDAAHAPSPSSGQGASLSIEDAVVLAKTLRELPSPQAAFAHFESSRRTRVENIIKWAARINNTKVAGPIARVVYDAVLPVILRLTADSKALRRVYDYHIEWEAPRLAAGNDRPDASR